MFNNLEDPHNGRRAIEDELEGTELSSLFPFRCKRYYTFGLLDLYALVKHRCIPSHDLPSLKDFEPLRKSFIQSTKARQLYMQRLQKADTGGIPYAGFPCEDLQRFVIQRRINSAKEVARLTTKTLVANLEKADATAPFRFLDLPAELRVRIYEYMFVSSAAISRPKQPAIACATKLLRNEALPTFYSKNTFILIIQGMELIRSGGGNVTFEPYANVDKTDTSWLDAIGDENVRHVRSLAVVLYIHHRCHWGGKPFAGFHIKFDFLSKHDRYEYTELGFFKNSIGGGLKAHDPEELGSEHAYYTEHRLEPGLPVLEEIACTSDKKCLTLEAVKMLRRAFMVKSRRGR